MLFLIKKVRCYAILKCVSEFKIWVGASVKLANLFLNHVNTNSSCCIMVCLRQFGYLHKLWFNMVDLSTCLQHNLMKMFCLFSDIWFRQLPIFQIFGLDNFQIFRDFGLDNFQIFREFGLDNFPIFRYLV